MEKKIVDKNIELNELRKMGLELEKVEERLSYQGRYHLSSLFFIPLSTALLVQCSAYVFGVNDSYIKTTMLVLTLFGFLVLAYFIGSRAEKYNKLASNIKCLNKTVKQVLDNASQDR